MNNCDLVMRSRADSKRESLPSPRVPGGSGQPLEPSVRRAAQQLLGHDLSHVRIHADADAARSAQALKVRAYTLGNHVVFASGRYAPGDTDGHQLLVHELVHVIQQSRRGSVALAKSPEPPGSTVADPEERAATDVTAELTLRPSRFAAGLLGTLSLSGFDTLKASLKPSHLSDLSTFAGTAKLLIRAYPTGLFVITGHTDATGTEAVNEPLAKERAEAVSKALTRLGIPDGSIQTVGMASSEPAVPTSGPEARNRRVVIRFVRLPMGLGIPPLRPPAPLASTPKPPLITEITPKLETPEERLNRILLEPLPAGPPKRSLTKMFWTKVDDRLNSVMRAANVPDWMRGPIRDGAHAAIEKIAEAPFSNALTTAGVAPNVREAVLAVVKAAMAEPDK